MGGLGNIPPPSSPLPHLRSVVARVELTCEILSIHGFASFFMSNRSHESSIQVLEPVLEYRVGSLGFEGIYTGKICFQILNIVGQSLF